MNIFVSEFNTMIVFYTENVAKNTVQILQTNVCDAVCSVNCTKTKSKCCNKYQKKGINCKRCPLTVQVKIAS